jgi:para-nitrobenzyl esterase
MAGFTSGEVRALRFLLPPLPASADVYTSDIRARYGDLAENYLRLYPARDLDQTQLDAARDVIFGWTAERLVRKQAAIGVPSFLYYFSHDYPSAAAAHMTAFHASEVPFVFGAFDGTPAGWPAIPDNARERKFSGAMLDYWSTFARSGSPTATNGPAWKPFAPEHSFMSLDEEPKLSTQLMPGMYELQEQIMCRRRHDGTQSWDWRAGSIAPVLPKPTPGCGL